jgi:hypothetical protein
MTGQTNPRANYVLVESLESSIQRGGHALADVPGLLKRVLIEDAWREFVTRRGELVRHERFLSFVTTPPLGGLGATDELLDRIVADDSEARQLLKRARLGGRGGRPGATETVNDSCTVSYRDHRNITTDDLDRLEREAPDEYASVRRGEKTVNAAAISAGIRRRRIPVRLDSPESAAETLRKHMPPDTRRALARLLIDD